MKEYIPGETKEQRKARKAKAKEVLPSDPLPKVDTSEVNKNKNYIVCLKYGNKYGPEYVNKLYNMVQRNTTVDHEFVCFTEDSNGIDKNVRIEGLPFNSKIQGWWYKPFFFDPNLVLKGTILFLDLDVIIFRNIDRLFTYEPGKFCIIRDFNRYLIKNYDKFNSSVFRLETGQHQIVYNEFQKNYETLSRRFPGDQDLIRHFVQRDYCYWPNDWIMSYKWEMRGKPRFNNKPRGYRDFLVPGNPTIKDDTSIAVFHGDPNPHICQDKWVIDNWK